MNSLKEDDGKISVMMIYTSNIAEGGLLAEFQLTLKDHADGDAVIEVKSNATDDELNKYTFEKSFVIQTGSGSDESTDEIEPTATVQPTAEPTKKPSSGSGSGSGSSSVSTPTAEPTAAPEATDVPSTATPSPTQTPSVSFSDVNGHWAEESIKRLSVQGLVNGFEDGTFHPDDTVTRAQFVKMIIGAIGSSIADSEQIFSDVSADAWYAPYVTSAYKLGITSGDGVNFYPDNNISRQEMAVMTVRAFDIENGNDIKFIDSDSIADWAVEAVKAISNAGVMGGYEDNSFRPEDNTTRAQAAVVIDRIINQ